MSIAEQSPPASSRPISAAALRSASQGRAVVAGLAALLGAAVIVMWCGRDLIFLADDWAFLLARLGGGLDTYLSPHNEHLSVVSVALYKALFVTAGISEYWPYRLAVLLVHLLCVVLVFTYVRRRIGSALAVILTAPILVFGPGWEVLIFPFDIAFLSSIVAGVGMMLALDRGDREGDVAAAGLLVVALASSSVGIAIALGALVEIVCRQDRWRRAWVVVIPLLLYAMWYVGYNMEPNRQGPLEPLGAPAFAFRAAAGTLSALLGMPLGGETLGLGLHPLLEAAGFTLLLFALGALARLIFLQHRLTPRLAMLLTAVGSFWLLAGVTRAYTHQPYASRYVYPAAVLVLLVVAEATRGTPLPRRALPAVGVLAALAAALNTAWLVRDADARRSDSVTVAAELGALEIVRDQVAADFRLASVSARDINARTYFHATSTLDGSPALSPEEIAAGSIEARRAADALLLRAVVRPFAYSGPARALVDALERPALDPRLDGSAAPYVRRRGGCVEVRPPHRRDLTLVLDAPATGLIVKARGAERLAVGLRRFAPTFSGLPVDDLRTRTSYVIPSPLGRSTRPWQARFSGRGGYTLC